jgi:hypothetical protein
MMTSIFNASTGAVGMTILFHFASNASFVFLPLLPEQTGGEMCTLNIFVALALVAALATVLIKGPASLSNKAPAT